MTQSLESIRMETGPRPQSAVIWLHGLGADGNDFAPIVPELRLPTGKAVRFVFPHAPVRAVTINQGMRMRAWYDIFQFGPGREDDAGIRDSESLVKALIADEIARGIPVSRIVLAGFSQGGAIALHTALRYPERLAGVLALSTYLPLSATLEKERSDANRDVPIFMGHGQLDDLIPPERAEASRNFLTKENYKVEWRSYPMPHSVCPEEIADTARFLVTLL